MTTMNKPAQNSTTWHSDVAANWTSVENDLIDKSVVAAKGDLVVGSGASSPTRLVRGNVDSMLLADSTQATGLNWGDVPMSLSDTEYLDDLVYDKRFFSASGLLPGTKYYETAVDTAPTVDWDNTAVTPSAVGTYKKWLNVSGTQLFGWDLGAARQRILVIMSGYLMCNGNRLVFVSSAKPASGDFAAGTNGYAGGIYKPLSGGAIYRITNGAYTSLSPNPTNKMPNLNIPHGVAFRFDNGNIRIFYRFGRTRWMEGTYKNDGTHTTLRYTGVAMHSGGAQYIGPVSIWYDT